VNLTSNRLLWEFWLSFFYSQGSLRYKAFLDYKKAYRLQNPTAIRGHLHLAGLCLFSFPFKERRCRLVLIENRTLVFKLSTTAQARASGVERQ